MKAVRYTPSATKDLKRHANMAARIRGAIMDYATTGARSNMITRLIGSTGSRMRVGDFRVIFEDGETEVVVTKIAPRGSVYD